MLGGEVQRFAPAGRPAFHPDAPAEEGVLDGFKDGAVRGWARRVGAPAEVMAVDLYLDEDYLGRAFCDVARKDLAGLEGFAPGGRNAFVFTLPAYARRRGGQLHAVAAGSGLPLTGSPSTLLGELTAVSPEEVRTLLSEGWYAPAASAATSLAEVATAYGRRLPALAAPDPDAFDASWPVTAAMAYVNARVHEGALEVHGARAYVALLLRAAEHFTLARAGLPVDAAQAAALAAPTGWLLPGRVRSTVLLDVFCAPAGAGAVTTTPARDEAEAADTLVRFALEVLAGRRLPLELIGDSARAFLSAPAGEGRTETRFAEALTRSTLFADLPKSASAPLVAAAVRAAAQDRGFGAWVGAVAARAPASPSTTEAGVRILSADYSAGGLSLNARHSLAALEAAGVEVETALVPVSPETLAERYDALATPARAAALIHATPEDAVEIIVRLPSAQADARLIGFYMWETEGLPARHRLGVTLVDEVWTASRFCQDLFSAAAPAIPVHVVGHAVEPPEPEPGFDARAWAGVRPSSFMALFHFDAHSWISRKNPLGVVRAFRQAFPGGEDAVLVIKVRRSEDDAAPWWAPWWEALYEEAGRDPRIILAHADLTGRQMASLTQACDAFVSLHRAEGFGYGLAEAMLASKPVIATAYSGNLDFTLEGEALLVPANVRPIRPREFLHSGPGQRWGEPDLDAAASALRRLYEEPDLRARLGALGRARMEEEGALSRLSKRYAERLRAGAGPRPAR